MKFIEIKGIVSSYPNKQKNIYHFRLNDLDVFTKLNEASKLKIGQKIIIKGKYKTHPDKIRGYYFKACDIRKGKEK